MWSALTSRLWSASSKTTVEDPHEEEPLGEGEEAEKEEIAERNENDDGDEEAETLIAEAESSAGAVHARTFVQSSGHQRSYFKQVKWSPDGSCLLTNSADAKIRLFPFLVSSAQEAPQEDGSVAANAEWTSGTALDHAESVHDMAWYPFMTTQEPATCCFFVASREHPIHLRDAYTLQNRASYIYMDHRERMVSPYALALNHDATKLYGTCDASIVLFDVQRPGNECQVFKTSPTRRSREGQKGVLSCIDLAPNAESVYAVGSYDKSIWLYDARHHKSKLKLKKQKGGVTQVTFSDDGLHLFSANRTDDGLYVWDIRQTATCLITLPRKARTNQRIQFEARGSLLLTGDTQGNVLLYDWTKTEEPLLQKWHAHDGTLIFDQAFYTSSRRETDGARNDIDTVNSVAFHPHDPAWIVTASGSRQQAFRKLYSEDQSSSSSNDSDDEDEDENKNKREKEGVHVNKRTKHPGDHTIKVWR